MRKMASGYLIQPFVPFLVDHQGGCIRIPGARWNHRERIWEPEDSLGWVVEELNRATLKSNWQFLPDPKSPGGGFMVLPTDSPRVLIIRPDGSVREQIVLEARTKTPQVAMTPDGWLAIDGWWISPEGHRIEDPLLAAGEVAVGRNRRLILNGQVVLNPAGHGLFQVSRFDHPGLHMVLFWDDDVAIDSTRNLIRVWKNADVVLEIPRAVYTLILPDGFWATYADSQLHFGHPRRFHIAISPEQVGFPTETPAIPFVANMGRPDAPDGWTVLLLAKERQFVPTHPVMVFIDGSGRVVDIARGVCPATSWVDLSGWRRLLVSENPISPCVTILFSGAGRPGDPLTIPGELESISHQENQINLTLRLGNQLFVWNSAQMMGLKTE